MSQTYYNHTSTFEPVKEKLVPASTVALKVQGGNLVYGVSICSKLDNFSRVHGREIATARLENGFGKIPIPQEVLQGIPEDVHDFALFMLYSITKSLIINNKKWKRDITRFTQTGSRKGVTITSSAKVVEMKDSPLVEEYHTMPSEKTSA